MELLVALLAFAGALLAGMTTGILIARLRGEPAGWLIAWSITTAALALSLGAIAVGHLAGFGELIFRTFQITGSLLAPLWLAVGVMQLLAEKASARFAGWLIGISVTIVGAVILLLDPVSGEFTKRFPSGAAHWDIWPEWLLRGVHGLVVVMLLLSLAIAVLSWRDGDDRDVDNMNATVVLAPAGMAIAGAMELALPGILTVVLMAATAGGIWYAVARPLAPYDDEDDEQDVDYDAPEGRAARTAASAAEPTAVGHPAGAGFGYGSAPEPGHGADIAPPRRSGLGDLVAEYRAGEQGEVDYAARMRPADAYASRQPEPDDFGGPATGQIMASPEYAMPATEAPSAAQDFAETPPIPEEFAASLGVGFAGASARRGAARRPEAGGRSVKPSPGIYGLLTVFTLLDGSGEAFDKLAEETVEAVQRNEPDTLVFVCHAVKSAPLQRIVYELYRDEVAYAEHQRQPHMERFVTERQPMVLAANVIELTVNAGKVVPLPTALF